MEKRERKRFIYRYEDAHQQRDKKPEPPEKERARFYRRMRGALSRRRHMLLSVLNVSLVIGFVMLFFFLSLLMDKPTESKIEKRKLATIPDFSVQTLFKGQFTRGFELFFADTFPMRDWFVGLSAVVEESYGVRVDDVRIIAPPTGQNEEQGLEHPNPPFAPQITDQAPPEQDAPAPPPEVESPPAQEQLGAISNGSFVYNGMAMSLFGGSLQNGSWYADVLNLYQQELPGVRIYNMVVPTAIEFYVPDKYRDLTASQKAMIDHIYSRLDSGVRKVDAYAKLEQHKNEYLYFRTDHHWTGLGAYYAYTAFCEQAGLTPIALADCETRTLDQFIGTMYAQTKDSTLLKNPDHVDYYIFPQRYTALRYATNSPYYGTEISLWGEYAQSPNSYSVFLHGDAPLIKVSTGLGNARRIMVVKESFGNAFAPFLINHYDEVYIVDLRYFQLAAVDFIRENQINELIFVNNSFAACTPYHIRKIDNMRHQPYIPYVPPEEQAQESSSEAQPEDEMAQDDGDDKVRRRRSLRTSSEEEPE